MKKLLKTYLWVSISSCLFSDAAFSQTAKIANDLDSLAGFKIGESGIAEHASDMAPGLPKELASLDTTGAGPISAFTASARSAQAGSFPDGAINVGANAGSHTLFEASALAVSASKNAVTFNQIFHSGPASTSSGTVPTTLSPTVRSSSAISNVGSAGSLDGGGTRPTSLPASAQDSTPSPTANTRRIQKFAGALAGAQASEDDSAGSSEPQLSFLASADVTKNNSPTGSLTTNHSNITSQVIQISGNGTAASPFVLSGSGDITSYIEANQYIQLGGGNYTITIPASTSQQAFVNGNVVVASGGAYDAIQVGTPLLIYSGVISGQGQVTISNAINNSVEPGIYTRINGGALSINQAQTFTNPNLTGGAGSAPQAVFVVDPNTFLALERNGLDGGPLTTVGSIPVGQTILNNGFLYLGNDATYVGEITNGAPETPAPFNGGLILSVTGNGYTALGPNAGENGTQQQFIGGKDSNGNPVILGPSIYAPGPLLTLDQVHIQDHSIVNEDVYSHGDTNVVDAYGSSILLESQYGGNATVASAQKTILNGNIYTDAAENLVNGNSVNLFMGQAFLVSTDNQVRGQAGIYTANQAEKLDFLASNVSWDQGRLFDITGGTMLLGAGQAIVDNGDGTNNTFAQGNPFGGTNFLINTGDFDGPVTNASQLPYLQTLALDYSGTYTFNIAFDLEATGNGFGFKVRDTAGGETYGNFILVTPPSGINHVVVTQPLFYQGLTDVQLGTILQLGDGTTGTNPNTTATLTLDGHVFTVNGTNNPNLNIQTSGGNGMLVTASNSGSIFSDPAVYQIYDNGLIVVDNTPGAQNILAADHAAGEDAQTFLKLNQLDTISGSGGLEQSGALALTLAGNTVYTGPTTIDPGRTLYLKSSFVGASGLPNSTVHIGNGAVFDLSQGDAVQYVGGLDSTVTVTAADLNGSVIQNADGTQVVGASSPTGITTTTTDVATSGTTYIGQTDLHIGSAFSTGPDAVYNGAIVPGGDGATQTLGQVNATATAGGSLTKEGNFKQTLNGINLYTGSTTINGGTLALGPSGSIASSSGVFLQPETILVDTTTTHVQQDDYLGTYLTVQQIPTATKDPNNLNKINTTSSQTVTTVNLGSDVPVVADPTTNIVINNPTDQFGTDTLATVTTESINQTATTSSPALEIEGNQTIQDFGGTTGTSLILDSGSQLNFGASNSTQFDGIVQGSGNLNYQGKGTVFTLTGDNPDYTGITTITSGTLQLGNGGTTGSIAGNVIDNATLVFNRADAVTFDGIISGTGQLIEQGPGNLLLTADNPFTGTTTIHTGTLQLGNGGTSGNLAGNIVDSTALIFDRSDSVTYGGVISGGGTLSQNGSGTLVLDGTSSFTGGTSVATGTLLVGDSAHGSAAIAGDVSVASGATLSGHGLIGGNVTIASGAHLAPGDSIATLSIGGDLDVAQGGLLDDEFGKPNAVPTTPGSSDQVNVAGNLTLNGAILNVTADTGFGEGLYTLFNYGGTLTETNGGILFGAVPANDNLSIQTLTGSRQINLLDVPTGTLNFWNGNGLASPTQLGGGDGAWSLTAFNWSNAAGTLTGPMQPVPGLAIFAGAAGTVTVDNSAGAVSATGLQFATDGYVLNGGTLTLVADTGGNAPSIRVGDGTAAGASDVATVANVLAGTAGLVKTDYGTLVLTAANTYTGGTTISAGTLQLGNGGSTGAILGAVVDNGTFAFDHADALSFGAVVSGTGGLTQQGSDTLTLTGANSYTGPTTISAGTLALGATGSIANSSSVIDNSTFDISNALNGASIVSLAGNGTVNLGAQTFTLTNAADTFGGVIAGTGGLTLVSGEQILTGSNTYTGGTTISGGTLQLGNGGASGSVTGDIADNGTVAFDRSDITTVSQAISGSGGVRQAGAGTTILAGNDSYTGGTEVASGDLQVDTTLNNDALVDAGGTLSGTGQVAGLTVNGNLLIGDATSAAKVFNAAHNVVFNPGSQFQVYVDPSGAHSLLQVAGSTVLNGGNVSVSAASGSYGVNQSYEILQSTGGVSGTFNGVLVTNIDLAPTLQYQPNGVFLVLDTTPVGGGAGGNGGGTPGPQPIALFPCAQLTANQCATEHALQAISLQPPAALLPTLNALVTQTLPQARISLDGLNGQIFADANMAALRQMGGLRALIDNRASQPGDGTIWFQAHSDDATLGNPSQTLSASVDNQGSYAGIQRPIDDRLQLGAFVGDTRTNLNLSNGDHARLSTPQFGLYMTGVFGPNDAWYGNGSFGYGHPQVRTTRYVRVVDSSGETSIAAYSQNLAALSLELGYHGLFGQTHLDPFLAYDGAHVKRGLTNENSDQPLDLTVQGRSMVSSLVSGGVHLSRDVTTDAGTVVPELTLAVARQQGDLQGTADTAFQAAPGIDFQTDGARSGRLLETASGGVSAHLDHGWTASLDATYTHASHENDRGLQAKLALSF